MDLVPVTLLVGGAGTAAALVARLAAHTDPARIVVVRNPPQSPAGTCACCAMADGLTRALREAHFSLLPRGRMQAVVVDSTGVDPRPAIAALARAPLASLRFALSQVVATSSDDGLASALADAVIDPLRASAVELLADGLYASGTLDARGWLERGPPGYLAWSRPEPCRWEDVEPAVQMLQLQLGERLVRLKGVVEVLGEPGPRLVQAFGHTRYPSARLAAWPGPGSGSRFAICAAPLEAAAIARILGSIPVPNP